VITPLIRCWLGTGTGGLGQGDDRSALRPN
jgi:hypothetical protein